MKKIILFLILLIPCLGYSQSGYYNKLFIKDSIYSTSGIANFSSYYQNGIPFSAGGGDAYLGSSQTFTGLNKFTNDKTEFGDGSTGAILNFNLANDLGKVSLMANNSRNLLVYDDDSQTWDFKYPISLNGVPFTTGGGDAYLGNRQTFSARNVFNDTLLANSYAEFDNIKLTNYITFLGNIISDLGFLKSARINIGTSDNYGMAFKTADTVRVSIDSLGLVQIQKQLNVVGGITSNGDITAYGNLTGTDIWGDGANITGLNGSNISTGTVSSSRLPSNIPYKDTRDSFTARVSTDTLFVKNRFDFGSAYITGWARRHAVADANYTMSYLEKYVAITSITATREITLPIAAAVEPGYEVIVLDESGQVTNTKKIIIKPSNALPDYINGTSADTIYTPYAFRRYVSNGVDKWTYDGGLPRLGKVNTFTKDLTVTGKITGDSLAGNGKNITGITRGSTSLISGVKTSPAVSTSYYIGNSTLTPQTDDGISRIYIPITCTIKAISLNVFRLGSTSSQSVSAYLQVNGSDVATLTTSWNWSTTNVNSLVVTGLTNSITSGDYISIRLLTPAWTPNVPTSFYINGLIVYE